MFQTRVPSVVLICQRTKHTLTCDLDRNLLHFIHRNLTLPPIIMLGRPGGSRDWQYAARPQACPCF